MPKGSLAVRVTLNLLDCNAVQSAPGHNHFTQLQWQKKMRPVVGSLPMLVIARKCACRRLTKPPSTEGGVAHISSKLLNS